jgi:hypothetical protein
MGWWVIYPPYHEENRYFTMKHPPPGVTVTKDAKRAYDTIQSFKGSVTDVIPKHDMGVFDVFVQNPPQTPRRQNRVAIKFVRDPRFRNGKSRQRSGVTVKNRKQGPYFTSSGMVSRHPIGKRKRT